MKRIVKIWGVIICIASILCETSLSAFAYDSSEKNQLPPNHEVVEVEYVPYDYFVESGPKPGGQPSPRTRVKYIIKNASKTGETLGSIKYTSDEGVPGVSVGINRSTNLSASCSATGFSIIKAVSAKLGFSVTASYSVGASSSWTVPEKKNGRKIKYGYIIAKPVYDNWKYDVYIDSSRIDETFLMKGTATKPRNRMRIEKIVVYN